MNIKKITAFTFLIFIVLIVLFDSAVLMREKNTNNSVNISAGRINEKITEKLKTENIHAEQTEEIIKITESIDYHDALVDHSLPIPERTEFISAANTNMFSSADTGYDTVITVITDADNNTAGFLKIMFRKPSLIPILAAADVFIFISFLAFLGTLNYISQKLIKPFKKMQEYPEKIALGITSAALPESEKRNFGKFIWGMNMLNDKLKNEKKAVSRLEHDRQALLTSIAHGVKTPVANIKLYAEAIQTGLYNGGKPSPNDAEIAKKISKNADDIRILTSQLIETTSTAVYDYTPEISEFYLKEPADIIEKEYSDKFRIRRTSFSVKCTENPLLHSDRNAIVRICIQLLENALKYGDGKKVSIVFCSEDNFAEITVKNTGTLLSEEELSYVFNSFWRGSNSVNAEGNGIGLYVSSKTAHCLGGELFVLRHPETEEMEFTLMIPL